MNKTYSPASTPPSEDSSLPISSILFLLELKSVVLGFSIQYSASFNVVGEVNNLGLDDANSVRVSGIFYDNNHDMLLST